MLESSLTGVLICALGALLAFRLRAIDGPGAITGFVVAAVLWSSLGWPAFVMLAGFVVLGSAATRLGFESKQQAGLAEERGGRRGMRNVLANGGVAALAACAALFWPESTVPILAFCGALATAASDTLASEVGSIVRGPTLLITRFRPVAPGTNGGVSWAGTAAGVGAALAMGGLAAGVGLIPLSLSVAVATGGFAGNLADSLLGATLENRGLLDNESVNLLATLAGALATVAVAAIG